MASTRKKTVSPVKKAAQSTQAQVAPSAKMTRRSLVFIILAIAVVGLFFAALIIVPKMTAKRAQSENSYNNFEIVRGDDGFWYIRVAVNKQPYLVVLHHHPRELESIAINNNATEALNALATMVKVTGNGELFITMDPDEDSSLAIAGFELAKVLGKKTLQSGEASVFNIPTAFTYTKGYVSTAANNSEQNRPVVTCQDATNTTFVILVKTGNLTAVAPARGYPQCIIVQGSNASETVKAADRLVYDLFNVMRTPAITS
jgi:hypothetical protein